MVCDGKAYNAIEQNCCETYDHAHHDTFQKLVNSADCGKNTCDGDFFNPETQECCELNDKNDYSVVSQGGCKLHFSKSKSLEFNLPQKIKPFTDYSCGSIECLEFNLNLKKNPCFCVVISESFFMLTKGHWIDFEMQKSVNDHLYSGTFVPDTCDLHKYTTEEIDTCIKKQNYKKTVHIIGDSRARLIYRVLLARLRGDESVEDVKVHDNMANLPFIYYWSQSFNGRPSAIETPEMSGFENMFMEIDHAQLVIIDEHFLHPSFDYFRSSKKPENPSLSTEVLKIYFKESVVHLDQKILPKFTTEGVTVVVMASEGCNKTFPGWPKTYWKNLTTFYGMSDIKKTKCRTIILKLKTVFDNPL